jgi:DNA repair protein RecN (Recombination protein N)
MLRHITIRNFVVVASLDAQFEPGLTVLTGETGAGKSILLDALGLLLGDRFELRQLRAGAARAELAATFDIQDCPAVLAWLAEHELAGEEADRVLVRRVLDAQGKSRGFVNGTPVTLAQLADLGERLVDLHGQHAHQALEKPEAQRGLVDAFGGFTTLAREVASRWHAWQAAIARRDAAAMASESSRREREALTERERELRALGVDATEWTALAAAQTRLANAAELIAAANGGVDALDEGEGNVGAQLAQITQRLRDAAGQDPSLGAIVALLEPAGIQVDEAARALRDYRRRLDLDPAELKRVEERLSAIHDMARKHRVRPEALPALLEETRARLTEIGNDADAGTLARRAEEAAAHYADAAGDLAKKRRFAGSELAHRVTTGMQEMAMEGGRLEIAFAPLAQPASHGQESVEFLVASHPKQPLAPLARVASGGELSRIALAIQVAASEVGDVPTLVFDEVDSGIGGAVAATVGTLLQTLATRRQVLCVTHLPQVAACADAHYLVAKNGNDASVETTLTRLADAERVDELARMLGGSKVTAKTRANAEELRGAHRRRRRTR